MTKKYFSVLLLIVFSGANAQIVTFTNNSLKSRLLASSPSSQNAKNLSGVYVAIDVNDNNEIEVSEALQISYINLECFAGGGCAITNLVGLEQFTNLQYLNISGNPIGTLSSVYTLPLKTILAGGCSISSLNFSSATLEELGIYSNTLSTLNATGFPNLKRLSCGMATLTNLNITGLTNLEALSMDLSGISSFNFLPFTSLKELDLQYCNFTSLNVSSLTNLEHLYIRGNSISSLDLSNNPHLKSVYFDLNPLGSLDFSNNPEMTSIRANNCGLTSLNLTGCSNLGQLECYNNQLSSLIIPSNKLTWFSAHDNLHTTLDLTGNILEYMECYNNNLQSLFLKGCITTDADMGDFFGSFYFSNNPALQYVCVSDSRITQVKNRVALYGYTNCQVNSYCSFVPGGTFYTIQGSNRFDGNDNGCDASDSFLPNLKFTITGGETSGTLISNTSGDYSIPVQSGSHLITPVLQNPTYFNISPASVSVNFPTETSPFIQNFCISANGTHPDLEVMVLPLTSAIPGFDADYKIIYTNKGNQQQSGSVSFTFNDAVSDFVSATPTVSIQSTGNLQWGFSNIQPFESRAIYFSLNLNSPTETPPLNDGDILHYSASVDSGADETPNDNNTTLNQSMFNSFDPNDKTCLEGQTIAPEMIGKYMHYKIRFENTGTFPATNIVVQDLIDISKFDITSLMPLDGSHSFYTRMISGNRVEFIFENINLPFDDANNDGYVAFKIKTKPTLVVGDTFSNSASIYFDYNFPIITNTATTLIQLLGNTDFEFSDVFVLYPNPTTASLNIKSKNGVEVTSVSIYNMLGQLLQVITGNAETIDVSGLTSGNYFIKVISDKGMTTTKFIKE